jgi:hypothetical protein
MTPQRGPCAVQSLLLKSPLEFAIADLSTGSLASRATWPAYSHRCLRACATLSAAASAPSQTHTIRGPSRKCIHYWHSGRGLAGDEHIGDSGVPQTNSRKPDLERLPTWFAVMCTLNTIKFACLSCCAAMCNQQILPAIVVLPSHSHASSGIPVAKRKVIHRQPFIPRWNLHPHPPHAFCINYPSLPSLASTRHVGHTIRLHAMECSHSSRSRLIQTSRTDLHRFARND